jgi:hypothetical protein
MPDKYLTPIADRVNLRGGQQGRSATRRLLY